MIGILSEYVRNIAVFLLLISFVGIITPNNKYKGYINLVIGFMLIFIMLAPISNIVANSYLTFEDIFSDIQTEINQQTNIGDINNIEARQVFYENSQLGIILDTFRRDIIYQVEGIVKEHGFTPTKISIDINDDPNNFGEILSIYMHILEVDKEESKTTIIKIDEISIETINNEKLQTNDEKSHSIEVKNLKNYISHFYNLSVDNIHITIQD